MNYLTERHNDVLKLSLLAEVIYSPNLMTEPDLSKPSSHRHELKEAPHNTVSLSVPLFRRCWRMDTLKSQLLFTPGKYRGCPGYHSNAHLRCAADGGFGCWRRSAESEWAIMIPELRWWSRQDKKTCILISSHIIKSLGGTADTRLWTSCHVESGAAKWSRSH